MPDKFDPYREALVMEEVTIWPDELDDVDLTERRRLERLLHDSAEEATQLAYHRTHSGFCREIAVTQDDLDRVRQSA